MRKKIECEKEEDSTFNYSCIAVAALAVGAVGAYYTYKIYSRKKKEDPVLEVSMSRSSLLQRKHWRSTALINKTYVMIL